MDQSNQEREQMALRLAREEGARQATVDGRLDNHEDRLDAINGSVKRTGDALKELGDQVAQLVARQTVRDAVDADRLKELKRANERQISTRTFILGVIAILIPLIALLLSIQGGMHA